MRTTEILVWTAAFIVLSAMKVFSPGCAEYMGEKTAAAFQGGCDYRLAARRLGAACGEGELGDELRQAFGRRPYPTETTPVSSKAEVEVIDPVLYVGAPAATPSCEAVQAFLSSQESFDGWAIPANVNVDMPELGFEYVCPVAGCGSSGFGYRLHPLTGEVRFHYGTDIAAETGEPVLAFADGYVYAAGTSDSYGNYYILTHSGGVSSLYAHLSEFVALEGERVRRGQLIGAVGATGETTGPHLHFELRQGELYLNPEYYI